MERRAELCTFAIQLRHATDGDKRSGKRIAKQVSSIGDVAVLDGVVDIGNDRNPGGLDQLQAAPDHPIVAVG